MWEFVLQYRMLDKHLNKSSVIKNAHTGHAKWNVIYRHVLVRKGILSDKIKDAEKQHQQQKSKTSQKRKIVYEKLDVIFHSPAVQVWLNATKVSFKCDVLKLR